MTTIMMTIKIEPELLESFSRVCTERKKSVSSCIRKMVEYEVAKFNALALPLPEFTDELKRSKRNVTGFKKITVRLEREVHRRFVELVRARVYQDENSEKGESVSSVVRDWMQSKCPALANTGAKQ